MIKEPLMHPSQIQGQFGRVFIHCTSSEAQDIHDPWNHIEHFLHLMPDLTSMFKVLRHLSAAMSIPPTTMLTEVFSEREITRLIAPINISDSFFSLDNKASFKNKISTLWQLTNFSSFWRCFKLGSDWEFRRRIIGWRSQAVCPLNRRYCLCKTAVGL